MPLIQVIDDGGGGPDIAESVVRGAESLSLRMRMRVGEHEGGDECASEDCQQKPPQPPPTGSATPSPKRIETYLVACRAAALSNDIAGLDDALDHFRDELLSLEEIKSSTGSREAGRYNVALGLIRLAPHVDAAAAGGLSSANEPTRTQQKIGKCLELCGPSIVLLAATNLLRGDAATAKEDKKTDDASLLIPIDESPTPSSVAYAIQTARRCLFGRSEHESVDDTFSSLGQLCQDYVLNLGTPMSHEQSMRDLADRAILLPVGIGSACHRAKLKLPSWAIRERYCKRLVEISIESAVLAAYERSNNGKGEALGELFLGCVLEKMSRHGASDPAVLGLHRYWYRKIKVGDGDTNIPDTVEATSIASAFSISVASAVTKITPHRDAATLLRSMVRYAASELEGEHVCLLRKKSKLKDQAVWSMEPMAFLRHACLPPLNKSEAICNNFFRLVVMSPSPSESLSVAGAQEGDIDARWLVIPCIVSILLSTMSRETSLQYLLDASETWAETIFVRMTDQSQQYYVTEFIEASIPLMDKDEADAEIYQSIVLFLVQGVTARLESSNSMIRRQGMRVAELLAPLLGQKLHFAELNESQKPVSEANDGDPKSVKTTDEGGVKAGDSTNNGINDDDSVWSDEDLVPYDLEDDEDDLAAVKRPRYLRDCLLLFRTPSNDKNAFDAAQAAVTAIAPLVESTPPDLPDLAVPLAKELLHAEDKFHMNNFASLRWDGLCALLVNEPVSVANFLVENLTDGSSFGVRLDILGLFEYGADKLCGAANLRENREVRKKLVAEQKNIHPKTSGKRQLVPYESKKMIELCSKQQVDALEQKTRRWGQGRRNSKQPSEANRFGEVAPMWFYQLISAWIQTKDNVSIWGGSNGSKFFANYLVALAKIVECSGNHPGTAVLALDLFQLAIPFRHADSSEIRMAVLVTIATCCPFLPAETFSATYEGEEFASYLTRVALRDTDASCRQIAGIVGQSITSTTTDALALGGR